MGESESKLIVSFPVNPRTMITALSTIEDELICPINIIVRNDRWGFENEKWGIQLDNTITPLYCSNCKTQLPLFYHLQGSRYGQVGTVECSCGAAIHCTDSDNIVEYLDTMTTIGPNAVGHYHMDFKTMYQLDNESFIVLKEKTGFDLFRQYGDQTVQLKTVLTELKTGYGIKASDCRTHSYDKLSRLPMVVNEWLSLLETLKAE